MKKKLTLLGELISACDGVKTRDLLAMRLAQFMYDNFRCVSIELAWGLNGSPRVTSVTQKDNKFSLRKAERDINQSAFSEVLMTGAALVSEVQDEIDDSCYLEERRAVELFASQLVVIPINDQNDINGFLVLYLLEQQNLPDLSELLKYIVTLSAVVLKSCDLNQRLTALSRRGFKTARQMRENLVDLVWKGESEAAGETRRQLLRDCRTAAQCTTAVFIDGEQGTDKEEVARHIHSLRTFDLDPFIVFDCAAAPKSEQQELLFGGTGRPHKKACLEKIGNGTLYLTAIEELSAECQELLIEFIENNKSSASLLISGSPDKKAASGDFNSELLEVIREMTVHVPSLRECREDLPMICRRYGKELAGKLKLSPPKFSRGFMQTILASDWKGNHRELKDFMEKAMICSQGRELQIPQGFAENSGLPLLRSAESLDESIKRNILDALRKTRGKIYGDDGAAVILGLNPSTLQSKMRKLGIKKSAAKR